MSPSTTIILVVLLVLLTPTILSFASPGFSLTIFRHQGLDVVEPTDDGVVQLSNQATTLTEGNANQDLVTVTNSLDVTQTITVQLDDAYTWDFGDGTTTHSVTLAAGESETFTVTVSGPNPSGAATYWVNSTQTGYQFSHTEQVQLREALDPPDHGCPVTDGPGALHLDTRCDFNSGTYSGTSADRASTPGALGLGHLNRPNPNNGSLEDGLLRHYRLDNTSGDVVDWSGYSQHGTPSGSITRGATGTFATDGFQFDGSDDYVDLGANTTHMPSVMGDFTWSAWVYLTDKSGDKTAIGYGPGTVGLGYDVGEDYWYLYADDGNGYYYAHSDSADTNRWVHLTGVWDGSQMDLYVDGEHAGSSASFDAPYAADDIVTIGRNGGSVNRHWPGRLDDIRIYERALTASDVTQLYLHGRDGRYTGAYESQAVYVPTDQPLNTLNVDATIPAETTANATIHHSSGATETISLSDGNHSYPLDSPLADGTASVNLSLTSTTPERSPEIHEVTLKHTSRIGCPQADGPGILHLSTRCDFNRGTYTQTTADSIPHIGSLGLGYLNGTNPRATTDDTLVGYWRLDESGPDQSLRDYSGYGNDVTTIYGADDASQPGVLSTDGLAHDGSDAVYVNDSASLSAPAQLTLSGWIKTTNTTAEQWFWRKPSEYTLGIRSGTLNYNVDANAWNWHDSDFAVEPNQWYHVTYTWDGTTHALYVNGTRVDQTSESGTIDDTASQFKLTATSDTKFIGTMDEVRVYNRSLSRTDIQALYLDGRDGTYNGSYTTESVPIPATDTPDTLTVNASLPENTTATATLTHSTGSEQTITLADGTNQYPLRFTTTGGSLTTTLTLSSTDPTQSPRIHDLTVNASIPDVTTCPITDGPGILHLAQPCEFNAGEYTRTTVDRHDYPGNLSLGYLNGSNPRASTLEDGLAGYWRLDTESGDAPDYSGNNAHGTIDDDPVRGTTGVFGTDAFDFDGGRDHVMIGHLTTDDPLNPTTGEFTWSSWVNLDQIGSMDRAAVGFGQSRILLGADKSGVWQFFAHNGDTWPNVRSEAPATTNEWVHLTGSYNGTGLKLYVNGTRINETRGPTDIPNDDTRLAIGEYGDNMYRYWDGQLDEVRIYDRTLSDAEVEQLYIHGRDGTFDGTYTSHAVELGHTESPSRLHVDADLPPTANGESNYATINVVHSSGATETISLTDGSHDYYLNMDATGGHVQLEPELGTTNITNPPAITNMTLYA